MKACFLAVLAVVAVAAGPLAVRAEEPETQPAAAALVIATYNINYGNPNLKEVVKAIRQSKADVVCLQETTRGAERFLRRNLAAAYPSMVFRHDPRGGAGGYGFLSRKGKLTGMKYLPPKHGWFGIWTGKLTLDNKPVLLVATHLMPIVPANNEGLLGLARLFFRSETQRAREAARIVASVPKGSTAIILGDFNSMSNLSAPQYLLGRGYVDSFASVTKDPDEHVSWHWNYRGIEWKFRLDYIFHTAHFKTRDSRIIATDGSDHNLVVSTLDWTPPAENAQVAEGPADDADGKP